MLSSEDRMSERARVRCFVVKVGAVIGPIAIVAISLLAWGCPRYQVYQYTLRGQAALQEAEWDRQIAIEEASAVKESAALLAEAEVLRAHGVAEANAIIGESLQGNEAYLRYLWINGLHDGSSEVIYIPTEANLPILEARDNRSGAGR